MLTAEKQIAMVPVPFTKDVTLRFNITAAKG
jgi:hypothetical protein